MDDSMVLPWVLLINYFISQNCVAHASHSNRFIYLWGDPQSISRHCPDYYSVVAVRYSICCSSRQDDWAIGQRAGRQQSWPRNSYYLPWLFAVHTLAGILWLPSSATSLSYNGGRFRTYLVELFRTWRSCHRQAQLSSSPTRIPGQNFLNNCVCFQYHWN